MKIKLNNEKAGYFSVRKRENDGEFRFQHRTKTLGDEKIKINEKQLELQKIVKSPGKLHPLQLPSERYFKRVLNKDISPKKPSAISSTSRASAQHKDFTRSSNKRPQQHLNHARSQLNIIQQKQNESSTYNFSLGLFNKSAAMSSSFFETGEQPVRNSTERKLDFSKIFIETQDQSYRRVIQLSVRDLENKDMLEKAVQELNKRKFQKKIKILKNNMGLGCPKSRRKVDEAIEMLRNQSIGYKTFYQKEISTARCQTQSEDKSFLNSSRNQFQTPRKVFNLLQLQSNQQTKTQNTGNSQNPQRLLEKQVTKNNIMIEDQQPEQGKDRTEHGSESSSEEKNEPIEDEFRKTDEKFKIKMDSMETLMHNSDSKDFKLPPLTSRNPQQTIKPDPSPQINSYNLKKSQKPAPKSPSNSLQRLSTLIKSTQNETISMNRNRAHTKILDSIQDPFQPKQNEQNPALKQVSAPSDEFPFLMTKQDLQTTLNKSRYQMKKLLCMHIQRRQKEWKEMKRKLLLQEDNLETIKEERNGRNKSRKKVNVMPPEYLLKIPTKQLKKSVRSFVSLLNRSKNLSSQQKDRVRSELK